MDSDPVARRRMPPRNRRTPRADACDHRRADCGGLLGQHPSYRPAEHVRLDRRPQVVACSPADDPHLAVTEAERIEPVDDVAQRISAPFEDGAAACADVWFIARPRNAPRIASFHRGAVEPDSAGRNSTPSLAGGASLARVKTSPCGTPSSVGEPQRAAAADESGVLDQP